jgi:hypothetical protein
MENPLNSPEIIPTKRTHARQTPFILLFLVIPAKLIRIFLLPKVSCSQFVFPKADNQQPDGLSFNLASHPVI